MLADLYYGDEGPPGVKLGRAVARRAVTKLVNHVAQAVSRGRALGESASWRAIGNVRASGPRLFGFGASRRLWRLVPAILKAPELAT
jgi:hypothetical protein